MHIHATVQVWRPEDNSALGAGSSLPSLQGLQGLNSGCWVSSFRCTGCFAASQIIPFNLLIFFLFLFLIFFNHICWRTQVVYPLLIAGLYWQSPVALCRHTCLSPVKFCVSGVKPRGFIRFRFEILGKIFQRQWPVAWSLFRKHTACQCCCFQSRIASDQIRYLFYICTVMVFLVYCVLFVCWLVGHFWSVASSPKWRGFPNVWFSPSGKTTGMWDSFRWLSMFKIITVSLTLAKEICFNLTGWKKNSVFKSTLVLSSSMLTLSGLG